MKRYMLVLFILFTACITKEKESLQLPSSEVIDAKATKEYAQNLFDRAFKNLIINNKVETSKLEIDTLFKINKIINNERLIARTFRLNGVMHALIKDFKKSNISLKKCDSIFFKNNQISDLALTANYRVWLSRGYKPDEQREVILLEGYKLAKNNNSVLGMLHLTHELCVLYGYDLKQHEKSIYFGELFFKLVDKYHSLKNIPYSDEIEHSTRLTNNAPIIDLILSNSLIAQGRLSEAESHLDKIVSFFEDYSDYEKLKRIHLSYMEIYRIQKNFEKFNFHLSEYVKNTNMYNKLLSDRSEEALRLNIDINEELSTLRLLKKELKHNKKIENKNYIINRLLILMIIFGIILIFHYKKRNRFLLRLNDITHQKNANSSEIIGRLKKIIEDKETLENQIKNIQDAIAMDLHDNFGNRLSAIQTSCNILQEINEKKDYNSTVFNKFICNLETSMLHLNSDIRDLLWANNSKNNKLTLIIQRLLTISKELTKAYKVQISFKNNLNEKDYFLPKYWNRQIVLIIKEAMNNSCKHSGGSDIEICINVDENYFLEIKCIDYGLGFDVNNLKRFSGLSNMEKRTKSLDANLNIISKEKVGTSVIFKSKLALKQVYRYSE